MDLLIQNGRILDPSQGIDRIGDILVRDGKVASITDPREAGLHSMAFDVTGMIVSPGFVDLHCHLRQPGFEEKETIATGTAAAAAGGFTTVCCMPNTDPPLDAVSMVKRVLEIASKEGVVRVFPVAAVTQGRRGAKLVDMCALRDAGAIAFSDDGSPVQDSDIMQHALEQSKAHDLLVVDHCEEPTLCADGLMNEGAVAAKLGHKGIPARAEEAMVARDIELARRTGGRLHIAHVSTAGSADLIRRAKEEGVRVTAEVTPHHLTLTEETVLARATYAKVNPPLRTQEDIRALIAGLRTGVIDAIATDHAPHTLGDKACDFAQAAFGISGFETALGCLMSLVHRGDIDLALLISKMTCEPATIMGNAGSRGSLIAGSPADITIFDPDFEWVVDPAEFVSKGKNTPLAGVKMKGKVIRTLVDGEIVHDVHRNTFQRNSW